ncbi:hypothetical protein ACFX2C_014539 [Malus domestica]
MEHVIAGKLKLGRKIGSGSFEELYLDDIVNNFCDFKTLGVLHCIPTSNIEVKSRFGDFEMVDAGPVTPQQRQCWHVDDEELGDEEEMMKADDQKVL